MPDFLFVPSKDDNEAGFFSSMQLEGGPHLIDMAAEAKIINF